jgi:predicted DNA-binding ribbon-helix-helix protein
MPEETPRRSDSTLVNRNVWVGERRTSLRLEPTMWQALDEVAALTGVTIHRICTLVDQRRRESSLTAAIRVFLLTYYRAAAAGGVHGRSLLEAAVPPERHGPAPADQVPE